MANTPQHYLDPLVVGRLKNMEVKARLIVEGFITGMHRSPYHGFSVEFAEHRPYNTGESLRNIDWRVYARRDKLYVRRYEEETNLRCHLVLDVSDSMRYPLDAPINKLEYAAYLAGALGYLMQRQRDAVGLSLFDSGLREYMPPKTRPTWLRQLFVQLEGVVQTASRFQHRTATASALHQLAQRLPRRGLVVLFTDLFMNENEPSGLASALQHLRHQGHEVLVFQVLDTATEARFDFPDRPLIVQDLETGRELKLQPAQVRQEYRQAWENAQQAFRRRCKELKVELVELDIRTPYNKALNSYLIQRQRLTRR